MLCRIFRPIDWYHSLVPKNDFLRSYSGFRPFFGILFLAHNSKTAVFFCILSILRSHYFSISYQMAYSLFWGVDLFWKLFLLLEFILPVLLWVWRGQKKYICFEKRLTTMPTLLHEIFSSKLRLEKRLETEGHCRKLI